MADKEIQRAGKVLPIYSHSFTILTFASKIHATLLNTKHSDDRRGGTQKRRGVDCTEVFKMFGSHEFGEFTLECLHLSQRFAYEKDGYFKCIHKILFP